MDRADAAAPGEGAVSPGRSGCQAGRRERRQEERKTQAGQREREAQLRQHAAEVRAQAMSARERAAQAVEAAETALDANQGLVRRAEAAVNRACASTAREQASAARSVNRGEQRPAIRQPDFADLANRVSALRKRTAAAAAQLARTEEQVVRIHDELAACEPGNLHHAASTLLPQSHAGRIVGDRGPACGCASIRLPTIRSGGCRRGSELDDSQAGCLAA